MRAIAVLSIVVMSAPPLLAQEKLQILSAEKEPRKMLHAYLLAEAQKHFDARKKTVALLKTPDEIQKRQRSLRAQFIAAIGGFPDEKTPLNAKVVGTLKGDGFRVEKVIHETCCC